MKSKKCRSSSNSSWPKALHPKTLHPKPFLFQKEGAFSFISRFAGSWVKFGPQLAKLAFQSSREPIPSMSIISKVTKASFSFSKVALVLGASMIALRLLRERNAIDFRGRVVAITGGSRGLGLNLARQLAEQGAKIALIARDEKELERAKREIIALGAPVFTVACDLRDRSAAEGAIEEVVAHFGSLDAVINNAGVIQVGPLEHMLQSDFEEAVNLHLWAPLWISRAAIPHLKKSGGGRIVNIASIGGMVAMPHMAPYAASKFALVGLSDALRHELAKDGILVTTVCPGILRTGSHVMATFKGNQKAEYRIFKLMAALGGFEAPQAANLIIDAARYGDPQLVFPAPVKAVALASQLFPNTAALVLGTANRFMPGPTDEAEGDEQLSGHDLEGALPPSIITNLADRAVGAHNEMNGYALEKTP
jgi:NAD(P)-dependent dehydrogenase (short-subunit alcohol dehydrogenase family)